MKKSLIALAVLGSITGAAMAQSSVTIYGMIDVGVVKQSHGESPIPSATKPSPGALGGTGLTSNATSVAQGAKSRLGFKGVEDLGGGLSAKFALEHRFTPDDGAINAAGNNAFWDQAIVGLTSQTLGEIALGRDYVPAFYAQYLLDPWLNQGIAEIGGTTYAFAGFQSVTCPPTGASCAHPPRANNSVFYNAKLGGLTVMAHMGMSETAGADRRLGLGVTYADGPLFLTAAYDRAPEANTAVANNENVVIVGGAYDFGVIKPRLSYARSAIYRALSTIKTHPTSLTLAATAPLGSGFVKAGYSRLNLDYAAFNSGVGEKNKQQKFSLGYEYTLSKRTAVYADATHGKTKGALTAGGYSASNTGYDVGIRHTF